MAARAMWKGTLHVDGTTVPVKLYSAVEDRSVRFNILDDRSMERVRQRMVRPDSSEEVNPAEIRRGYQAAPDQIVIVGQNELAALVPPESRDIHITQFMAQGGLPPQWFVRPYFLGPDNSAKKYFALAKALAEEKVQALVAWVMRKKRYNGLLYAEGDHLMLISLRFAEEVVAARNLPQADKHVLDSRELKMAEQLIEALAGEFDPAQFKDDYRERVLEFIEQKAAGNKPRLKMRPRQKPTESIADALEASLRAARKSTAA